MSGGSLLRYGHHSPSLFILVQINILEEITLWFVATFASNAGRSLTLPTQLYMAAHAEYLANLKRMYLGSITDINCDDLGEFPLPAPILYGNEEELYDILRLPNYPRAPALYEATVTDEELNTAYNATLKYRGMTVDNMYVRLSKAFHYLHDEYGSHLDQTPISPSLGLQRINLQIISGFINLIDSNLLPYRLSRRGIPEFMNVQAKAFGVSRRHPIPIESLDDSDEEPVLPPLRSSYETTSVGMGGADRNRRHRSAEYQREEGHRSARVSSLDSPHKITNGLDVSGLFKGDRTDALWKIF